MIVIDASAMVEALLSLNQDGDVVRRRLRGDPDVHAPHLVDAEATQVVRRLAYKRVIDDDRASEAIRNLRDIRITRHPGTHLLPRVWALRQNFSAYDATYVALAETLDAKLLTRDDRLAASVRDFTRLELA